MKNTYSNLPLQTKSNSSSDITVRSFDLYYEKPVEISADVLSAIQGFFSSKGFDEVSSQNIAFTIIKQAKKDDYNPMQILDTLKGLDTVEISALVSEILNNNRFKTSYLGYARGFVPIDEIQRNIIA